MKTLLLVSLLMFSASAFSAGGDCYQFGLGAKADATPYKLCLMKNERMATISEGNNQSMMFTKCTFVKSDSYSSKLVDDSGVTIFDPLLVVCENNVLIAIETNKTPGKLVIQNVRYSIVNPTADNTNKPAVIEETPTSTNIKHRPGEHTYDK